MAKQKETGITWCDYTFNHIRGCTKVSEGCQFCYAETLSGRNPTTLGIWGPNGTRVLASDAMWKEPLKWNREAEGAKERPRVFCASLADIFEDWNGEVLDHKGCAHYTRDGDPLDFVRNEQVIGCDTDGYHYTTLDDVRARLFHLIDSTPNLNWLLLTKRPENIRKMWPVATTNLSVLSRTGRSENYRSNCWIGTTVENQQRADERIPELLKCRDLSPVLWLSCEPLLGPVDLNKWLFVGPEGGWEYEGSPRNFLRWVIAGTESGAGRRPMQTEWAESLKNQCTAAGVAFFMKQMEIDGKVCKDVSQFPEHLRLQEFPRIS
jgi:protein gp37